MCIGGEQTMISHQVCPGTRYQRGQTSDEVRGLEQYVSGTVGERAFELEDDQAVAIDAQTLLGDGSSGHVTTYAFELGAANRSFKLRQEVACMSCSHQDGKGTTCSAR